MIVQPKKAFLAASPATIKTLPGPVGEVTIECEVISPRSAVGRTVYVRIPPEQIPAVLQETRHTAILARSQAMGESAP